MCINETLLNKDILNYEILDSRHETFRKAGIAEEGEHM